MKDGTLDIPRRLRRLRKSSAIRALVQEHNLHPSHFVAPFFVMEGKGNEEAIKSMPGVFRYSIDTLLKEFEGYLSLGVRTLNLFCYTKKEKKDLLGKEATKKGSLMQKATSALKAHFPEACLMVDIALDPFTTHGHDGIVRKGEILNDPTVETLALMSLRAAEAGADVVSPSDMMDGRVKYIREALDKDGFHNTLICSYAAKCASSFYGPFRDALHSSPAFGDKKSYQMNGANCREAIGECLQDEKEGADMLLIKPALLNLDIIAKVKEKTFLPVGAYQVSGEYAAIKALGKAGLIDEDMALLETLTSIRRAGADFIFTYGAKRAAELLNCKKF
jgi:porphobilinogen synthase